MLTTDGALLIAKSDKEILIKSNMLNRHGLIAGATGTGKTVTLQVLAETFSSTGVPVFMADIKGDLSGVSKTGQMNPKIAERVEKMGLTNYTQRGFPVTFWDVYGEQGHPLHTTISEMGPFLLSRLMNLNDVQSSVLTVIFKIADDHHLLLLDLKDLQKMCEFVGEKRSEFLTTYGNLSAASIGSIQRELLNLEQQGAGKFFCEPALDIYDFMQTDSNGKGMINVLAADKLMQQPRTYSTMLLFILSELFEQLPEVGDLEKPKLVFFFDEAHLLFNEAPKVLIEKIEQVVRLIRSKGVGIYFCTQNPLDLPDTVLGQLGNKVQHALRAFTPRDQKAVKAAAETFRSNPGLNVEKIITEMGVGEALVSFLDEKGIPQPVEHAKILPPEGQIGTISFDERNALIRKSIIYGVYEKEIDRESAFEVLSQRLLQQRKTEQEQIERKEAEKATRRSPKNNNDSTMGDFAKVLGRAVSSQVGRQIGNSLVRGLFESLRGGSRRR